MKFFKKFKLENLKRSLKQIWQRMPLSFLLVLMTTGLSLYRIYAENISHDIENILNKVTLTLVITFFLSIGIYLFYEAGNYSKTMRSLSQIDSIIFAAIFYYFFEENLFDNSETFVYIIITLAGVLSLIYIAPFIHSWFKKEYSQQDFINHASLVTWKAVLSIITGVIIMLLGFAALASTFALFEIENFFDEGKMFGTWAVLSLSLMAPLFFLISLPRVKEIENYERNKFHFFVVNYLSLPAITVYFIILYVYTAKVLINFSDWPRGMISWLVIGFSIFGYLVYFATKNFVHKFKAVRIFRKVFPILVLPQVAMLFYAISLRINQHDWTINRYLVVVFGIWLTLISLYYIFSKRKYLAFMPASLAIFILIISLGPWSVYLYPEHRQENKLKNNLKASQILQNGEIIPLENYSDIDAQLSGEIYGSIDYLCRYHGCETLDHLFGETIKNINEKDGHWALVDKLTKEIKVKRYYDKENEYVSEYLYFNIDNFKDIPSSNHRSEINIQGYDTLVFLENPLSSDDIIKKYNLQDGFNEFSTQLLTRYHDGELLDNGYNEHELSVTEDDLSFEFENEQYQVVAYLQHFRVANPEWRRQAGSETDKARISDSIKLNLFHNITGYILLKNK